MLSECITYFITQRKKKSYPFFCGLGMGLMKMWVTSASWLGEFSCSQAVEMKTILSAWEAVGVGGTTHSCSEFCLCSSHVGPSYCTFCRLSPINGHFWLTALCSDASRHSDYSCPHHVTLWVEENVRAWGRWKDIFRQDDSHGSLTAAVRGTWRSFQHSGDPSFSLRPVSTKLTWNHVDTGAVIFKESCVFKWTCGRKYSFPFGIWPLLPSPAAAWLRHTHPHLCCSCQGKERGCDSFYTGGAPGLSCLCVAFGTLFCKHWTYFHVSPWDFFLWRKTFSTFPSSFGHEEGNIPFVSSQYCWV